MVRVAVREDNRLDAHRAPPRKRLLDEINAHRLAGVDDENLLRPRDHRIRRLVAHEAVIRHFDHFECERVWQGLLHSMTLF